LSQLFQELKRRNVFRVTIAYLAVAWLILQAADIVLDNIAAPDWLMQAVMFFMAIGLPIAIVLAWAFEMTPDGIKKETEVDRTTSITQSTGKKLDRIIIAVLGIAVIVLVVERFVLGDTPPGVETIDKSVAVLPFVAMSSGPDDEYFADGLTEEILNSLAQLPELLITARTSAFSFKGQDIPVQEIASALGVKHIVEGSVRRSGDRLRVTAQLIRAEDGFHLWSENYDSTSTDTISVQENIAEQIASAMDVVLDEEKREAMKAAGLRDPEAFTLYQKGLELFLQAHGDINLVDGLRRANVYFEQVIERVPTFSEVYLLHSDLFVHALTEESAGVNQGILSEEELANAYPTAIADYEAAAKHSTSKAQNTMMGLDLAYFSGDWRGLDRRITRALDTPGCDSSSWIQVIADVFGYSEQYLEQARRLLACDPRWSLSWFNLARSTLRSGDSEEALRIAREGTEVAPGGWLATALVRSLVANGKYDEALMEIDRRIDAEDLELAFKALVAAAQGEQSRLDQLFEEFKSVNTAGNEWVILVAAWGGHREEANRAAAMIDEHHFGSLTLTDVAQWCACGKPFDLEATPNYAAKLKESGLSWSPPSVMDYPLKDW